MNFFKELWRNKIVSTIIVFVILLIIFSIIFPIRLLQNLTTQLTIIIALIIPFIMKGIERKDKESDEKDIVIQIIKRIKDYLKNLIGNVSKRLDNRFSPYMSFFRFIIQKFPEILIKIGIEVNFEENQMDMRFSELYILDKYCLKISPFSELILIEEHHDIKPDTVDFEEVLGELIDHVNGVFSFKISKELAKF